MSGDIIKSNNEKNTEAIALITERAFDLPTHSTEVSLSDFRRMLLRRWKTVLTIAGVIFAGTTAITFMQTPKYESETLILVNNESASAPVVPGQDRENQRPPLSSEEKEKVLSTEIQVLQSYPMIASAVKELRSKSIDISVRDLTNNLYISQAADADFILVSYQDPNPYRAKGVLDVLGSSYVKYSLERQRSRASNAVKFVREKLPEARKELEKAAQDVRNLRQKYGITDPDRYAERISEQQQLQSQKAQDLLGSIASNQRRYDELRRQITRNGQNPESALAYSILTEDKVYQDLIAKYNDVQSQYNQKRSRFQETYPEVQELKLQLEGIQSSMQQRAQQVLGTTVTQLNTGQVSGAGDTQQKLANELLEVETQLAAQKSQLEAMRQSQTTMSKQFQAIPQIQEIYADLQRQLKVKSEAVNNFMERLQELEIVEAQEVAPWKVIQPAYLPTSPSSPNIPRNLLLGLVGGSLLGLGTALLQERLDKRVKGVAEVKKLAKLPLLGAIPKVNRPSVAINSYIDEAVIDVEHSSFTESLRSLAMNLRYLDNDEETSKVILMTSASPGEGKSTIVYNLAVVLAELGLRVLVVDSNMRRAQIHNLAQKDNESGLSTVLVGHKSWSEFIKPGVIESLHILTAGPTPSNPVALLNSQKMKGLLEEWRESYDYVLIDTPIVGKTADVHTLADRVDSVILVTGIEHSSREAITYAVESLRMSRSKLSGTIANFVDRNDEYFAYLSSADEQAYLNGNGNKKRHQISGSI